MDLTALKVTNLLRFGNKSGRIDGVKLAHIQMECNNYTGWVFANEADSTFLEKYFKDFEFVARGNISFKKPQKEIKIKINDEEKVKYEFKLSCENLKMIAEMANIHILDFSLSNNIKEIYEPKKEQIIDLPKQLKRKKNEEADKDFTLDSKKQLNTRSKIMTRGNSKRDDNGLKEEIFCTNKRSRRNAQVVENKEKTWQEIIKIAATEKELFNIKS
jgi:hypothetical protein